MRWPLAGVQHLVDLELLWCELALPLGEAGRVLPHDLEAAGFGVCEHGGIVRKGIAAHRGLPRRCGVRCGKVIVCSKSAGRRYSYGAFSQGLTHAKDPPHGTG